jgi:hypothetical protein
MCLSPHESSRFKPWKFKTLRFRRADEMNLSERGLGVAVERNPTLFIRENYTEEAWRILYPGAEEKTPFYH